MNAVLNKEALLAVLGLSSIVSDDGSRYHLNHIYLHIEDGKLLAKATDGHKLGQLTVTDPSLIEWIESLPSKEFYISPKFVKAAQTLIKITDKYMSVVTIPSELLVSETFKYPNFNSIIPMRPMEMKTPEEGPFYFSIGFNADYIADIRSSLKTVMASKKSSGGMKVEFRDPLNPMVITPAGELIDGISEALYILMPLRV